MLHMVDGAEDLVAGQHELASVLHCVARGRRNRSALRIANRICQVGDQLIAEGRPSVVFHAVGRVVHVVGRQR